MIVSITGHRPQKIKSLDIVRMALKAAYEDLRVTHVIQGMAAGVDLESAKVAHHMNIPFTCARPWAGHKPRVADKRDYEYALSLSDKVVDVSLSTNYLGPWLYQARNEWMVNNAEAVIAVWDGTKGGTGNCVAYALKKKRPIWRITPATGEGSWYGKTV